MKKAYIKPEIMFEDFTLTTNIAAGCEVKTNTPTQGTCGLPMSNGGSVFVDSTTGCNIPVGNNAYNNTCYDVPTPDNTLFHS